MENSLHHLLMTNHTAFRKRIFSALKNEGLTSGQPKVLEYLAEHFNITVFFYNPNAEGYCRRLQN